MIACLMPGCASPDVMRPSAPAAKRVLLDVPSFPDRADQYGPAALAGVLAFWKKPAELGQLKNEVYRGNLKGSLPIDLLLAAQARGMSAEILDRGLPQLKKELDSGHPLIVFVNQGFEFLPIGRYMLVTGYDDRRRVIIAHSGIQKNGVIPYATFLKQWVRTDQWALLVLPLAG